MSSDKFDAAFEALIGHEGGYVNNPKDPGGETKFGISKRSYPSEDIRGLTLARAKEIYERDFWRPVQGDFWPYPVAFNLFDGAVNSGAAQSIKWLQHAVGTLPDGKIGPATIAAVNAMASDRVAARYNGARLRFMAGLPTWPSFGKGWARRIAVNLLEGD